MQAVKQAFLYSYVVSDQSNKDEFIVEFYPFDKEEQLKPTVIIKNFDELLEFLEQIDEDE